VNNRRPAQPLSLLCALSVAVPYTGVWSKSNRRIRGLRAGHASRTSSTNYPIRIQYCRMLAHNRFQRSKVKRRGKFHRMRKLWVAWDQLWADRFYIWVDRLLDRITSTAQALETTPRLSDANHFTSPTIWLDRFSSLRGHFLCYGQLGLRATHLERITCFL
jgi:hypothetical protein